MRQGDLDSAFLDASPGPVSNGRFLELELTLATEDHSNSPVVRSFDLTYDCPVF